MLQTIGLNRAISAFTVYELVVEGDEASLERLKLFKRVFRDESRVEVSLKLYGE